MLTITNRNKIVSSYANVLASILTKQQNASEILSDIKMNIKNIDTNRIIVNPTNANEYRKIDKILKTKTNKNDELSKFFYRIFARRYCFLLENIITKTEEILKNELDYYNVIVFSKNELNDIIKSNILKVLKSETKKDVKVYYKYNKNLNDDEIEIETNNKFCVISTKSVIKSVFDK